MIDIRNELFTNIAYNFERLSCINEPLNWIEKETFETHPFYGLLELCD